MLALIGLAVLATAALASCSGSDGAGGAGGGGGGGGGAGGSAEAGGASTTTTAGAGGAISDPDGSFSVLSYNVAGLPQEISKEHPGENLPKISPLLKDYDVVLTQEDFDWWKPGGLASTVDFVNYHTRLRADTDQPYRTEQHPGPEAVGLDVASRPDLELGDGLGVLSRFPIADTQRVPWSKCNGGFDGGASDCLAMKGFLLTRLTLDDGAVVDLYDLHGEAGGGPEDQALQVLDFQELAAFVRENSEGNAVILGGDTNLHTDTTHEDSGKGADIEIWKTFLEQTGLTDSCAATKCDDPGRIDKIAFRSGGGVELAATAHRFEKEKFTDADGEDLSDHEPLLVTFDWARS